MPTVQGIGGVFLYADDVQALAAWYQQHLDLEFHNWGSVRGIELPSADREPAGRQASTTFALFQAKEPLPKGVRTGRVNLRVSDLDALLARLKAAGHEIEGPEGAEYGRFAWVHDPEGNRLELWEPALQEG